MFDEGLIVRSICDGSFIQLILRSASSRDPILSIRPPRELGGSDARSLKEPLLFLFVLEHCKDPRLLSCAFPFVFVLFFVILIRLRSSIVTPGQTAATVHKISKLATSKLRTLYAKNKGDGIHEVRLARAIGTDDGGEIPEWANDLVSPVGQQVQGCRI